MLLPPDPRFCACCQMVAPRAPLGVWNRPGLSEIGYRIGTFATFREALLDAIVDEPALAALTTRESDDHAITLLELFAAVGDVLTFYNERIANELYLRTSDERDSILRLVRLISYRLRPGMAATAMLAYALDAGAETRIRIGHKVMSTPGQDETPQIFETLEQIVAAAELNERPVFAPPAPFNAFNRGGAEAPLIARPETLTRGDPLVFYGLSQIEEKTVAALEQRADGERLHFAPAVQGTGLWPEVAWAAKVVKRVRFFGHNAPSSHNIYDTNPATPPQQRWKTQAIDPSLDPSDAFYPLDARYEDVKAGAQFLIDAGTAPAPRLRSAVATETKDAPITHGSISDTVTHVRLYETIRGRPALVVRGTNLHLLARGGAGGVLSMGPTSFTEWASFGGFAASSDISAVAPSATRVDAFVRNATGNLVHAIWSGGGWGTGFSDNLGGVLTTAPRAVVATGGEVAVFARGLDFGLWMRGVLPAPVAWASRGGVLTSDPVPVSWGGSRIDVFVRGPDRALWRLARQGGVWGAWESLGGTLSGAPAAASTATNRLDVVALDDDGALNHRRWTGTAWTPWLKLGGKALDEPAIVASGPNRVDIFVRGADEQLWQIARTGNTWTPWQAIAGTPASAPSAVIVSGVAAILIRDREGVAAARLWDLATGWSGWDRLGRGIREIGDRRMARLYQLDPQPISFRNYDHAKNAGGGRVVARFAAGQSAEALGGLGQLKKGRRILLQAGAAKHLATVTAATPAASVPGDLPDHLAIDFLPPLAAPVAGLVLKGNIAQASHGETQPEESLGHGNAAQAFQKAKLGRTPLTYLPSKTDIAGAPALEIRVNGEQWQAVPSLYGRKPTERVFTARQNDAGETEIAFGDGVTGARLPTGAMNILARYRKGVGRAGNLKTDQLSILLERPVGLRAVTNPLPAEGGVDPETRDDARAAAPTTVRTFGRAVSLQDFEWIATTSGVVSRAYVTWVWHELERAVHLTVAGPDGAKLSSTSMATLNAALSTARDPNRQLFLANLVRVPIVVQARLRRDPAFEADAVLEAARGALLALFDFKAMPLGQAVHASSIYAALQGARGVVAVDLDVFHLKDFGDLSATELAVRATTAAPLQAHVRIFPARPTPDNPALIDRYAKAGFEGAEPPPVLAAEQAYIAEPATDISLSVVEAL
ncbi:MAG: putative baseplate assembly protein [Alphaproteobacteria bacterium]